MLNCNDKLMYSMQLKVDILLPDERKIRETVSLFYPSEKNMRITQVGFCPVPRQCVFKIQYWVTKYDPSGVFCLMNKQQGLRSYCHGDNVTRTQTFGEIGG